LLIHTPTSTAAQVSSVTSHTNILPAVAAAVGVLGNSSDAVSTVSADEGFAIAGHSNYTSTPSEWVFVRGPYKVLFGMDGPGHFIIHGVTDRSDRSVITGALLADPTFLETLRAMKGVEQSRASLGASAPPRVAAPAACLCLVSAQALGGYWHKTRGSPAAPRMNACGRCESAAMCQSTAAMHRRPRLASRLR
jgi:hypothetical protein